MNDYSTIVYRKGIERIYIHDIQKINTMFIPTKPKRKVVIATVRSWLSNGVNEEEIRKHLLTKFGYSLTTSYSMIREARILEEAFNSPERGPQPNDIHTQTKKKEKG